MHEVVVLLACKSGVHRSLAGAYLCCRAVQAWPEEFHIGQTPIVMQVAPSECAGCWGLDGLQPCEACRLDPSTRSGVNAQVSRIAVIEGTDAMRCFSGPA